MTTLSRAAFRRPLVALLLLAMVSTERAVAVVADRPPDWAADAVAYVRDPKRNRAFVRRFARQDPGSLPPLVQWLLADARFRAGSDRAAIDLAARALEGLPGAPGSLPYLLLGMIAFAQGDLPRLDDLVLRSDGVSAESRLAVLLLQGLAWSTRDPGAAALLLERLADDRSIDPGLRPAFRQAAGLTALWAGHPERAVSHFEAVATEPNAGVLADDARYAAAIARWRSGDTATAIGELEALAYATGERRKTGRPSAGRALLEQDATLRAIAGRLRRYPTRVAPLVDQVAGAFDAEVAGLAVRALEVFAGADTGTPVGRGEDPPSRVAILPAEDRPPAVRDPLHATTGDATSPEGTLAGPAEEAATSGAPGRSPGWIATALGVAVVLALAARAVRRMRRIRRSAGASIRAVPEIRPSPVR